MKAGRGSVAGPVLLSVALSFGLVASARASVPAAPDVAALRDQAAPAQGQPVSGSPAAAPRANDREATALHRVTGRVTGPDGSPVAGIEVVSFAAAGPAGPRAFSRPDGSWMIEVPAGRYTISFRDSQGRYAGGWYGPAGLTSARAHARRVVVDAGDVRGIDVRLSPTGGPSPAARVTPGQPGTVTTMAITVTISGTITGPGSVALAGIEAWACSDSDCYFAATAANGSYSLAVPPNASYPVAFSDPSNTYANGYYSNSAPGHYTPDYNLATSIAVANSNVAGVNASLPLAVKISGTITGAGSVALAGIDVEACTTDWICGWATTAANGSYSAAVPPSASYRVEFYDSSETYAYGYYSSSASGHYTPDSDLATSIAVTTGNVAGINVTLPLAVKISGTVTGPGSVALAGINVWACPTTSGRCGYSATAVDGSYSAAVPPSASYKLQFSDPSDTYAFGYYSSSAPGHYTAACYLATLVVVATGNVAGISVTLPRVTSTPFTDIAGSSFKADIEWLYDSGITKGCSATLFCPDASVTRGQMAAFLDRALSLPSTTTDFFTDDNGTTFEANINRLAASGITKGCTATTFCPTATVTRGQMAAFLDRAFALPATTTDFFTDDNGTTFEANINRLAASGITTGCSATTYCPTAEVTRGQMAAFLHRALVKYPQAAAAAVTGAGEPAPEPTVAQAPSVAPEPVATPEPSPSAVPEPSAAPSPSPEATPTPDPTLSPPPEPTVVPAPEPTQLPSASPEP